MLHTQFRLAAREQTMRRRMIGLTAVIALVLGLAAAPAFAQADIGVTGAGGGVYPPNTAYNSVPLSGLQFGFGVNVRAIGTVGGRVNITLLGTSALGGAQSIEVDGKATAGSATIGSTATVSGTATVDMGDGTAPLLNVPFTLTVVTKADAQGTLTLVLGTTNLPAATINDGAIAVQ
jgi:hypothetical protein